MRIAALVLLLASCAYESPSATYEITPHQREGGTCGPGKPWVEQLDKHSSAKHSYDHDGLHYEDRRIYNLEELTGYAEEAAFLPVTESRPEGELWCESVYDLTLRVIE